MTATSGDVLLVGGGLANGLLAWRLRQERPELRVRLVERDEALGGEHTWSFHDADVTPSQHGWLAPLVERAWPAHDVRFPGLTRRLFSGYRSITARRLHERVHALLGESALLGRAVRAVDAGGATLEDGTRLEARCVVDGRGLLGGDWLQAAVQEFVGLDVTLAEDHGLDAPMLMDATVPQVGGFRFFYVLPWSERRLLIEDTRYADAASLRPVDARAAIERYAAGRGWRIVSVDREERGVLPIPLAGDVEALWRRLPDGVAASGTRAGLFHATTGYSLPDAVRLADHVAALRRLDGRALADEVRAIARESWRRQAFLRFLNRMLFLAAAPERRWVVLARFYRLAPGLIERFYAGRLTWRDRVRLLAGRPPVPVRRAARCLRERNRGADVSDEGREPGSARPEGRA
jgi:lycopene beta-cyclase